VNTRKQIRSSKTASKAHPCLLFSGNVLAISDPPSLSSTFPEPVSRKKEYTYIGMMLTEKRFLRKKLFLILLCSPQIPFYSMWIRLYWQVFLQVLQFPPVSTFPPILQIHIPLIFRRRHKILALDRIFFYKASYSLVTLPRNETPYRDRVDGTRDRVTYQKLVTQSRYGLVRCAVVIWPSHQRDDTVTAWAGVDGQRDT